MMLRLTIFALLVASFATVGYVSGQDDFGEGLFIDGPGGFLPAGDSPAGDINSNPVPDSNVVFDPMPQANINGFMPMIPAFNCNDIWDIMGYWENLFNARDFPFWL